MGIDIVTEYQVSGMFMMHVLLLITYLYSTYVIISSLVIVKTPKGNNYMIIFKWKIILLLLFALVSIGFHVFFLTLFFEDIMLIPYEFMQVLDLIIYQIVGMHYIKKEKQDG